MGGRLEQSRQLTIGELIKRNTRKAPSREAFIFGERRYTYNEANKRVNRLANGLIKLGISRGDKVAVLFFNAVELVECYFAITKIGAIVVPLNFRLAGAELVYQINQSDSKIVVFGKAFEETIGSISNELSMVEQYIGVGQNQNDGIIDYEDFLRKQKEEEPSIVVNDDDPAFIVYTSGTTGKPKGAVLTHKNLMMDALNLLAEINFNNEPRWLCVPPLFHAAALGLFLTIVMRGGTTIIVEQFDPQEIPKTLEEEKISFIFLVPAMWIFLLQSPDIGNYDCTSLTIGVSGAAILPVEVKKKIMGRFPDMSIYDVFGQTEMSPCTTMLKHKDAIRKPGSVGQRIINVEARIVDIDGKDVEVGHVGEIVYRGPTTMLEYYKKPKETKEAMDGGWFHSGDLVREDEEGYIYVVDRAKDMIISGGENIYAAEVEEVLYTHPKVLEVAIIGVPDEQWGEAVKAIVVAKQGERIGEDEIVSHCKKKLASYKKPRSVAFIESLPRNAAGKVMKFKLREQYGN
jgi:acyl-CoA synthetase (AMP-forming)/AMP-acid ligase II